MNKITVIIGQNIKAIKHAINGCKMPWKNIFHTTASITTKYLFFHSAGESKS